MLIKYLENDAAPAMNIDMGHPWAHSPKSIGSIATMYLSILFMKDLLEGEDGFMHQQTQIDSYYQIIKKKNICKVFNNNLNHKVVFPYIGRGQSSDHHITAYLPGGVPGHQRGTGQSGHIQILPSLYIRAAQKRHGPDNRNHICPEGDSKEPLRHGQPISG